MVIAVPSRFASLSEKLTTESQVRTFARCVSLEPLPQWGRAPSGNTMFRWTDYSRELTYTVFDSAVAARNGAFRFTPKYAPNFSTIRKERGLRPNTFEIFGPYARRSAEGLVLEDLTYGRLMNSRVTHYWVDYRRPHVETPFIDEFYVTGVEYDRNAYRLFCTSILGQLKGPRGDTETIQCRNDLGDRWCKFDLDDTATFPQMRVDAAVLHSAPDNNRKAFTLRFTPTGGTPIAETYFVEDWFAHGRLIPASTGDYPNKGQTRAIASSGAAFNIGGGFWTARITLYKALPANISPADQFTIYAGCDKNFSTCRAKFPTFAGNVGNTPRFRGAPHLIGADRLTRSNVDAF